MAAMMCTFAQKSTIDLVVDYIRRVYKPSCVFIQASVDNPSQLFCTFIKQQDVPEFIPNTISIHRKKDFNTFYTINALNTLIRQVNNGVLDKSFEVDWDLYRDCYLLTVDGELDVVPIEFYKKINF